MSGIAAGSTTRQKLPVRIKAAYGLGTLAFGIKDQGFSALLLLYYNQVIGVPASWVGAAIMAAMILDAIADPLIGHISDNWVSPLGRRHPFMYASAIPAAISYLLLWSPPEASHLWQCTWLTATAIAVRISVSLFEIPNAALATEFTEDYEERTSLQTWRGVIIAIGITVTALVTFKYFLVPGADGQPGQLNKAGYTHYSWFAAATMFTCALLSAWGTQDRGRTLVSRGQREPFRWRGFLAGLRTVFLDKVYASFLASVFTFSLAGSVSVTLATYLLTYYWQITSAQVGTITAFNAVALILGVLLVTLTRRADKRNMTIILIGATVISCCALPLAGIFGLVSPATHSLLTLLVLQSVVACTAILALAILAASMAADIGDYFRLKTGHHIEGVMFSAGIMINKAVSGVGVFATGVILSFIGFPEKAIPGQLDSAISNALAWACVGSIGVLCFISMLCLRRFPITREVHAGILARLEKGEQGVGTLFKS